MTELVDLVDSSSSEGADQNECEFFIEDLISVRRMNDEVQFEVRWEGYQELTWEPLASLEHIAGPLRSKLNQLMTGLPKIAKNKPPNKHRAIPKERSPAATTVIPKEKATAVTTTAASLSRRECADMLQLMKPKGDTKAANNNMSLIEFAKNRVENKKLRNAAVVAESATGNSPKRIGQTSIEPERKRVKTTKLLADKSDAPSTPLAADVKDPFVTIENPERQMIVNHKTENDTVNGFELYKKLRLGIWKVTGFIQNSATNKEPLLKVQRDADTCWVSIWDVKRINNEGCGVSEQILLNYMAMVASHTADGIEFDDPCFK